MQVPFRFLDLPGEICNRIYDLAAVVKQPVSNYKKRPFDVRVTPLLKGVALTQVCRQIRTEYLPIQRGSKAKLTLNFHDVVEYFNTFYIDNDIPNPISTPLSLQIQLEEKAMGDETIDLLPLISLLVKNPGLDAWILYDDDSNMDVWDEREYHALNELIHHKHQGRLDAIRKGKLANILAHRRGRRAGDIDILGRDGVRLRRQGDSQAESPELEALGFETKYLCGWYTMIVREGM